MELPTWLNRDAWEGWVEQRKRSRHPLTERAQKMWLKDLAEWHEQGYDTTWVLNEAEKKDWRGLFINDRTPARSATKSPGKVNWSARDREFYEAFYKEHPELKPADWSN